MKAWAIRGTFRYLRYIMDTEPAGSGEAAAERAYRHLKARILSRDYAGGSLLTEGEVADAVGVSRTPVREAMLRLAAEGLLRLYPKRGALVVSVSADEVRDILEARELLETHAVELVLDVADDALIKELAEGLKDMRRFAAARDVPGFIQADRDFHRAMVAAGGNAILTRLYDSLRDRQLLMGAVLMRGAPQRIDAAVDEHALILAAVEAGDRVALRQAVMAHLATMSANVSSQR
jgi:DNA-binding GntR family transcriptional regulator